MVFKASQYLFSGYLTWVCYGKNSSDKIFLIVFLVFFVNILVVELTQQRKVYLQKNEQFKLLKTEVKNAD